MKQMLHTLERCWIILLILVTACNDSDESFWQPSGQYTLTLIVQKRSRLIPSAAEFHKPIRDTLSLELTVDSIRGSTAYGIYGGSLQGFAIRVGSPTRAGRAFQAAISGDSLHAELAPRVTDARLIFNGILKGDTVSGRWVTEGSPRVSGVFVLFRKIARE